MLCEFPAEVFPVGLNHYEVRCFLLPGGIAVMKAATPCQAKVELQRLFLSAAIAREIMATR